MDPITLLQVTHVEQRMAREAAASHNRLARARREAATTHARPLMGRFVGRRNTTFTPACATC